MCSWGWIEDSIDFSVSASFKEFHQSSLSWLSEQAIFKMRHFADDRLTPKTIEICTPSRGSIVCWVRSYPWWTMRAHETIQSRVVTWSCIYCITHLIIPMHDIFCIRSELNPHPSIPSCHWDVIKIEVYPHVGDGKLCDRLYYWSHQSWDIWHRHQNQDKFRNDACIEGRSQRLNNPLFAYLISSSDVFSRAFRAIPNISHIHGALPEIESR